MESRYELAAKFKSGQMVRIKDNIHTTVRRHSEDENGEMRKMMGRTFKILKVSSDRLHIGDYMWAPEDVIDLGEDVEPLPLPRTSILFDPKELL